ncbi:MAG: hypothetical protein GF329_09840 [Candidatus Lokiarchaeota archaeon]|nr:hypothetical protein [Candidatus Lokiarchaeota archaeon]
MSKLNFLKNLLNDPDKASITIISNYSTWKNVLLIAVYCILLGVNFWTTNFIFTIYQLTPLVFGIFCLTGLMFGIYFSINYNLYLYIFLRFSSYKEDTNKNLKDRRQVLFWFFLITALIYQLAILFLNIILFSLHLNYISTYIYDYGKFLLWGYVLAQSLHYINKNQTKKKFRNILSVLIPFLITITLIIVLNYIVIVILYVYMV